MQRGGKVADKAPAVGQVDVVHAGLRTSLRDGVALRLERAGGMNQQVDAGVAQLRGQRGVSAVQRQRLGLRAHLHRQGLGALRIAPRDDHGLSVVGRQRTHDTCAEVTVAAEDQGAEHA